MICTTIYWNGCKRNVINPNGEGCRKLKDDVGPGYPNAYGPAANWSTGKFTVSVQLSEGDPWQLRAYESDMKTFTILDEAPVPHVSAWSKTNWIAYHDWDDGGVYRIKPDGSFKQYISSSPESPKLLWHPEEDILLVGSADFIWRVDINGNLVEDTLDLPDSEFALPRFITPRHWPEPNRIYGRGPDRSTISYYNISEQTIIEVIDLDGDEALSINAISFLDPENFVFSTREGVFLFDLSSGKIGKRLLKGCENQRPGRLSTYSPAQLYMEVTLVDREGNSRRRLFRKDINKKSEEELEIF